MDMVTNLTKEVTHFKNNNFLLKQEINNLHSLIEASPWPPSQHILGEQRILPAEMSRKEAASNQLVPSTVLHTQALPAISIPAGTTLSYRDVAAAGPTALSDPDGFKTVTYRKKTSASTPLLTFLLLTKLNLADSPSSVLAALYPCLP
jgi:hypothetical protein